MAECPLIRPLVPIYVCLHLTWGHGAFVFGDVCAQFVVSNLSISGNQNFQTGYTCNVGGALRGVRMLQDTCNQHGKTGKTLN